MKRIGVKYCGACRLRYDRRRVLEQIKALAGPEYAFGPVIRGERYDAVLVMNGCQVQCADTSDLAADGGLLSVTGELSPDEAARRLRALCASACIKNT